MKHIRKEATGGRKLNLDIRNKWQIITLENDAQAGVQEQMITLIFGA